MANILEGLLQLFTGGGQQQFPSAPMPAQAQQAPARFAPLPQSGPVPAPMPQIPGGTFTPNRQDAQPPMPVPRPVPPPPQPANPNIPDNMAQSQNPLMALLSGGTTSNGRSLGDIISAAGAGMANIDPRNDDPFATFGRGAAGASGYYTDQNKIRTQQELEKQRLAMQDNQDSRNFDYKVGQDAIDNGRSDAELALRQAANERVNKSQDLSDKKTAMEISRMAKSNGITADQQLEIEKIAQKAGDNEINPTKKQQVIDDTRKRLVDQLGNGQPLSSPGLSGTGSLSTPTATGPNGEKLVLRDGQWVSQ